MTQRVHTYRVKPHKHLFSRCIKLSTIPSTLTFSIPTHLSLEPLGAEISEPVSLKMLTPTHVQLKYWMYPTGNTPAVNLLRNTSPSSDKEETIRVLCLACGDPRSILFTLWSEQGQGWSSKSWALMPISSAFVVTNRCWPLRHQTPIQLHMLRYRARHPR